jgi:diguanylate cyclase
MEDSQFYSDLLRAYFDSAEDAIFVLCDEMKFITCNKMTESWLGHSELELTAHNQRVPITQLLGSNYDKKQFTDSFKSALLGTPVSFETYIHPKAGQKRWLELKLAKVNIEDGDMVIVVARDISERKKYLAMINYQSHYDELTGLPNRTSTIKYLDAYQHGSSGTAPQLILFVLDLDRFKEINQTLGQKLGDQILLEISQRLQRIIEPSASEFLGRLGGDAFVIAMPNIDMKQARLTSQIIIQVISQPLKTVDGKISISASIGITALTSPLADSRQLIQHAEAAMYIAKSEKLGVSIYNSETPNATAERLKLVSELRKALKTSQVKPFYQPIINMNTAEIHVEALARWQHPVHDYISPDIFIAAAEDSKTINKLTSRIMDQALRECAPLLNDKSIESLSLNISPYCLSNPRLSSEIIGYLKKYHIDTSAVTLELTESAMMSNLSATHTTMQSLHKFGLSFSIDDFGTGYSSLSKLKQMPLKEIKIDKSFIMDIENSKNDAAITNAAIQMAHGLGLDVIAEGIENENIWYMLKDMGCDFGQGFWMAKPMPIKDLLDWLTEHNDRSNTSLYKG